MVGGEAVKLQVKVNFQQKSHVILLTRPIARAHGSVRCTKFLILVEINTVSGLITIKFRRCFVAAGVMLLFCKPQKLLDGFQ